MFFIHLKIMVINSLHVNMNNSFLKYNCVFQNKKIYEKSMVVLHFLHISLISSLKDSRFLSALVFSLS